MFLKNRRLNKFYLKKRLGHIFGQNNFTDLLRPSAVLSIFFFLKLHKQDVPLWKVKWTLLLTERWKLFVFIALRQ